jgi:hypothetical protein
MSKSETYANFLKRIIDGTVLSNTLKGQWLFIIYVEILIMFYIANQFAFEKIYQDTEQIKKEVYELKSEYIMISSKLMELCKESQVKNEVDKRNLKLIISPRPPKEIVISINQE